MQEKYPKALIHLEDTTGKRLFSEVKLTEAAAELNKLKERVDGIGYDLSVSAKAKSFICEKGFDEKLSNEVFELIEPFAGYAFNKAHSVSYAMIAYWTAYFKANYKIEYFTALLNSSINNTDKISVCVNELRKTELQILKPNIKKNFFIDN